MVPPPTPNRWPLTPTKSCLVAFATSKFHLPRRPVNRFFNPPISSNFCCDLCRPSFHLLRSHNQKAQSTASRVYIALSSLTAHQRPCIEPSYPDPPIPTIPSRCPAEPCPPSLALKSSHTAPASPAMLPSAPRFTMLPISSMTTLVAVTLSSSTVAKTSRTF